MAQKSVQKLFEESVNVLIDSYQYYACLVQRCAILWTDKVPTAAVRIMPNSIIEMVVNPEFFYNLSDKQRVGLIKHELLHLMNDHISRSLGLNPKIANVAMDTAINQLIPKPFLPPGALLDNNQKIELPALESFEIYYNKLMNDPAINKKQVQKKYKGGLEKQQKQKQKNKKEEEKNQMKEVLKQLFDQQVRIEGEKEGSVKSQKDKYLEAKKIANDQSVFDDLKVKQAPVTEKQKLSSNLQGQIETLLKELKMDDLIPDLTPVKKKISEVQTSMEKIYE